MVKPTLAVFAAAVTILSAGCSKHSPQDDLAQAKAGPPVKLGPIAPGYRLPQSVVPFGRTPAFLLSNLQLTKVEGRLKGSVSFTRHGQEDFVLVLYLVGATKQLVSYWDNTVRLTFFLPDGIPLMTTSEPYAVPAGTQGKLEFEQDLEVASVYDLSGQTGEAFVFTVPGKVDVHGTLPGDQEDATTFQADSNVLQQPFAFP
ncbi:MAG: hypothetical protein JXB32_04175 [Deltaproteobacteria bacterium]|nr:hypothetical protein [Deltaproteobacteria bacterium]